MEAEKVKALWNSITKSDASVHDILECLLPSLEAILKNARVKHAFGWLDTGGDRDRAHFISCQTGGIQYVVVGLKDHREPDGTADISVQAATWAEVAEVKQTFALAENAAGSYRPIASLKSASLHLRSGVEVPLMPSARQKGAGVRIADDGTWKDDLDPIRFVYAVLEMLGTR